MTEKIETEAQLPVNKETKIVSEDGSIISLISGKLPLIVDAMAELTMADDSPFYDFGGNMVTTTNHTGNTSLVPTTPEDIADYLMRKVTFKKKSGKDYVDVDLTTKYTGALLKRPSSHPQPAARKLTGITHGPTIRIADNSLLSKAGYDERTQLYLGNPKNQEYPESFPPLTKEKAQQALSKLRHLVAEFNFVDKVDESVLLGTLLTTQIRKQIDKAPGFAPTAPDIGKGKSYITDMVSVFATGQLAEAINFSGNKEENSKVLLSTLMEGGGP